MLYPSASTNSCLILHSISLASYASDPIWKSIKHCLFLYQTVILFLFEGQGIDRKWTDLFWHVLLWLFARLRTKGNFRRHRRTTADYFYFVCFVWSDQFFCSIYDFFLETYRKMFIWFWFINQFVQTSFFLIKWTTQQVRFYLFNIYKKKKKNKTG